VLPGGGEIVGLVLWLETRLPSAPAAVQLVSSPADVPHVRYLSCFDLFARKNYSPVVVVIIIIVVVIGANSPLSNFSFGFGFASISVVDCRFGRCTRTVTSLSHMRCPATRHHYVIVALCITGKMLVLLVHFCFVPAACRECSSTLPHALFHHV